MKKAYRLIALATAAVCALSICACSSTANDTAAANTTEEPQTGMANPMVEITDSQEFTDKLGITINPQELSPNAKLFIISDSIAHVAFNIEGVDGENVDVILRASKDDGDITGYYGQNMTEETMEYEGLSIVTKYDEEENTSIYLFSKDDINYSLMIQGEISQMLTGELLDTTLIACGLM